ncbi:MAG: hypothetical protein KAR12_09150 [Methylococcales bacterium]|nr:hypothetical protein [Methylococcales bacterium]
MNTIPHPSTKSLIWSCISSVLLAIIILIIAVLPAEYNIDPTGLGKTLGLTVLSQTEGDNSKASVISCPETAGVTAKNTDTLEWRDTVVITVPANKGLEYKFYIAKDEKLEFIWNTDGEALYFDFHGEPEGDKTGYFKSFKKSTRSRSTGSLTSEFDGTHGWYWKNNISSTVDVVLKINGNYQRLDLMKKQKIKPEQMNSNKQHDSIF